MKKLIVFDLDGTLAESKAPLGADIAALLARLMQVVKVAIISGGSWAQFEKQVLAHLPHDARLANLSLLPACGTQFYSAEGGGWRRLYAEDFTESEKREIIAALRDAFEASGYKPAHTWGELIEDRGSQITLSALGQEAPLDEKKKWDPDFKKRDRIKALMGDKLSRFSVRSGGATSIDVTRPGIDKAYGIRKLRDVLSVAIEEMLFVGDAIFPGGNDYPAKEAGAESIEVRDPQECRCVIQAIVACLRDLPQAPAHSR